MERSITIESPSNARVRELLDIRDGKTRDDSLFLEGLNVVRTAIDADRKIKELYTTEKIMNKNAGLFRSLRPHGIRTTIISEKVAKRLSDTQTPQGIFAIVSFGFKTVDQLKPKGIVPVIDRIQDPGNLGTIIRTSDAFGIKKIIVIEGSCNPTNQKVIRSSAASVLNVDIIKTSEEELVTWADQNDIKLLASDSHAVLQIKDVAPGKRSLLILGNEPSGVSDFLKEKADTLFSIPLPGKSESLNVAIASAIMLYEFSKKIKNT
jgi:TrmH family RNA methyltransferase